MNVPEFKEPPPEVVASILWMVLFFLTTGIFVPKLFAVVAVVISLGATTVALMTILEYYLD